MNAYSLSSVRFGALALALSLSAGCESDQPPGASDAFGSGGTSAGGGAANGASGGAWASSGGGAAASGGNLTSSGASESAGGQPIAVGGTGADGSGGGIPEEPSPRSRISLNDDWRFTKGDPNGTSGLSYSQVKNWVLPTGNAFVKETADRAARPNGNLGADVAYVAPAFDDSSWRALDLPHDYAIEGPFTNSISPSMARLPSTGVAWYRKTFTVPADSEGMSTSLELDGAMSYSLVWLNGEFVGGWPYGYASYHVDLTPYIRPGDENTLAIRLDNPVPEGTSWDDGSSRWYPGAGIYRNVWLTRTHAVHVGQWGTQITTPDATMSSATIELRVQLQNDSAAAASVVVRTDLHEIEESGRPAADPVESFEPREVTLEPGASALLESSATVDSPKLWGTPPTQKPNLYLAVTRILDGEILLDRYETRFGIRKIEFRSSEGFFLNGEHVKMNGVCNHHDLGALGAALHQRALERQFDILGEMGVNAVRTAHNPPAPEVLDIADERGILIMDEAFDVWAQGKAVQDHHVFFQDWYERDLRALLRRDRNHPSVIMWSIGNELVEQNDATHGPRIARELTTISHEEDPTRPTVAGMNSAKPDNPFSGPIDAIGLNYQGTGVRSGPPQYPAYHSAVPSKFIVGTETVSTFSSRGIYSFPVASGRGQVASGSSGVAGSHISSYDLYYADWSYSPDAEFESQDKYPYVGGEFVWTGFDYLGEPTPLDSVARSSYFGIIDLAGFKKDRFYLYQGRWRPDFRMAHILPHWTWPGREGQVTPVHVYTSGDEAELFLNGQSLGKKAKGAYDYRLRWDDVQYQPGELAVVAYKDGAEWATDRIETADDAAALELTADRREIAGDGRDLSFVTLTVIDAEGRFAPRSTATIQFTVSGAGELVATDNGDPSDMTVFSSAQRKAFSGMALAIVRAKKGMQGDIIVSAQSAGLTQATLTIAAR